MPARDEMFFANDNRSLRRGRRRAARTETCRPCVVWPKDAPEMPAQGVVVDVTPYGLGVRMLEYVAPGNLVCVQFMQDDHFEVPLSAPIESMVVRVIETDDGFYDHGLEIMRREIRRVERNRPVHIKARVRIPFITRDLKARMHTIDILAGEVGVRRRER